MAIYQEDNTQAPDDASLSAPELLPEGSAEKLLTTLPSELLLYILEEQADPDQVILATTCMRFTHLFLDLHPRPVRRLLCQHDNVTDKMQSNQNLPLACSLLTRLPAFHGDSSAAWRFCRNNDCHQPWPTQRDWWVENMATLSEAQDIVSWRRLKYKRAYIWWCIDNWCGAAEDDLQCEEANFECPACFGRWRTEGIFHYFKGPWYVDPERLSSGWRWNSVMRTAAPLEVGG